MKEIRLRKDGYYQIIENYKIISYPISDKFESLIDAGIKLIEIELNI